MVTQTNLGDSPQTQATSIVMMMSLKVRGCCQPDSVLAESSPEDAHAGSSQGEVPKCQDQVLRIDEERERLYTSPTPPPGLLRVKSACKANQPPTRMCAMLNRDIAELEGYGFVDQFFYQLWRTEPGVQRFCEPHLAIPHTVLFNCGQPTKWFFTSKQTATFGEFQKKKRKNATSPNIFEEFMKQRKNRTSDVIASYISGKHFKLGHNNIPQVEFLDAIAFKEFMSPVRQMKMAENEELGFLQVFVEPKNNFLTHGRRNFVLRVKWTPHICLVNARVNSLELDSMKKSGGSKHSIFERAATFEGNTDGSVGSIVSDRLGQFLKQMCTKIVTHMERRSPAVELMELNFKIDDDNTVWLLCCSSLQFHTGGKIPRVLLSPEMMKASSQGNKSSRVFTKCCVCACCGLSFSDSVKCVVSYKSVLLHYIATHPQAPQDPDRSSKLSQEPVLQQQLRLLELAGGQLKVPKMLQDADPRLSVDQLLRAIARNDMFLLYKLVEMCSPCATKILEGHSRHSFKPANSTQPRITFSYPQDQDPSDSGEHPKKSTDFVGANAQQGGTTNILKAHYGFDNSEDVVDIRETTLRKLLSGKPQTQSTVSPTLIPPLLDLTQQISLHSKSNICDSVAARSFRSPQPPPWCPSAAYPRPPLKGARTPRIGSAALRRRHRGIVLPSTRDLKRPGEEPMKVRGGLPLIERCSFRPPRLAQTSRHHDPPKAPAELMDLASSQTPTPGR
eukprot:TRINITY_DN761_c0_g1_i4.p1 TRINITY_DN761_c0_g1~~TRINITY_DN761_c0_g1_i4.p1  ORF type:complete len:730 (+),score=113.52 TRINITY_DN761_c0_g1_i4:190-2379(+)